MEFETRLRLTGHGASPKMRLMTGSARSNSEGQSATLRAGRAQVGSMRIRPMRSAWLVLGALFVLVGWPAIGVGVGWLAGGNPVASIGVPHGDTVAAIVSLVVGLSFLLPAAYFLRAEVTVRDGVLAKAVLFWMVRSCPVESLSSITRYQWKDARGTSLRGYEFKLSDGKSIFKLNSAWWSSKDIAQLGERLGIVISGEVLR